MVRRLPTATGVALDQQDSAADAQLLGANLLRRLVRPGPVLLPSVLADEQRVGVLVVHPQQPFAGIGLPLTPVDREIREEVVVESELLLTDIAARPGRGDLGTERVAPGTDDVVPISGRQQQPVIGGRRDGIKEARLPATATARGRRRGAERVPKGGIRAKADVSEKAAARHGHGQAPGSSPQPREPPAGVTQTHRTRARRAASPAWLSGLPSQRGRPKETDLLAPARATLQGT